MRGATHGIAERPGRRPSAATTAAICLIGGLVVETLTALPALRDLSYPPYGGIFRTPTWAYWTLLSTAFVATAALACAYTSPAGAAAESVATRVRRAVVGLGLLAAALPIAVAVTEALSSAAAAAAPPVSDVPLWPLAVGPAVLATVVWLGLSALTGKVEPRWAFALAGGVLGGLATLIYAVPATIAGTAFVVATAYGRGGAWPSRVVRSERDDEPPAVRAPVPVLRLRDPGAARALPAVRARRAVDRRPRRGSRLDRDRRGAHDRHGVPSLGDR